MKRSQQVIAALLIAAGALLCGSRAAVAAPVAGPELNPFACQGQAEAVEADRSIGQVEDELAKKMDPVVLPTDPPTVRAIKFCVIGELKKRVGASDAADWYQKAIEENPDEPGFEMFAGKYYGGARGAKGAIVQLAEDHFYRALAKLDALRAAGRFREYHAVVEDHVEKSLLVMHQQDGMPLLPFRAYPEHASGRLLPSLSIASQDTISLDTRDGPGGHESGGFAAEAGLYALRNSGIQPDKATLFEIVRSPLRIRSDNQIRLRQGFLGALDFTYGITKAKNAAITQFGDPRVRNDVDVREIGGAYERSIPLYPLFDLTLRGGVRRVHRVGVVEYLPTCAQDFNVYEVRPTLSRFVSSDKLTVGGTYVFMDMQKLSCPEVGPDFVNDPMNVRGRSIAAGTVEYAIYSPLLLPQLSLGSLRPYRTPTRGLYISGGYVNDNEVFGDRRVIKETIYGGIRLEGPGPFDIGITEAYYVSHGTQTDSRGVETPRDELANRSLRTSLTVSARLLNPDETPGIPGSGGPFAFHSVNWVFPASFDKFLSGVGDFENIRVGTQLWWQIFGTGIGGPALLFTAGYDYQYFYRIPKHMHNVSFTLRLGWRDL